LLLGGAAAVAQPVAADQASGTATLIQRQGQQQQGLIQGQAATQLSRRQAKRLAASAPQPPAQSRQPVSEAEVQLNRRERIRRLNASKVPAVTP
jgi:hypothetical protein